ncbi:MAG: Mov34/MPN/PAD-1 family protein [Solirubrobacteraceae bacterium]
MTSLSMAAATYEALVAHLSSREEEQVAFLFTDPPAADTTLRVTELYVVPREQFEIQSAYHVSLRDDVRGEVIRRAHELGGCLVEVHSHGGGPPVSFSVSDLLGFDEWVPHVRWRLHQRTYVALVFAEDAFDALVWDGDHNAPTALVQLRVDGCVPRAPSGLTYTRLQRDQA